MLARKALAGTAAAPKVYVEDVFSTYLWDGNATARNIVNGIDLSGEGGMVWTKYRNTTNSHRLYDTARGATKEIFSDLTNAESTASQSLTAFNADGFSLGTGQPNENTATVVGWTFRKAKKFFDIVTYSGNSVDDRAISHNLGSTPGCVIVRRLSGDDWYVYHRSLTSASYGLRLNKIDSESSNTATVKSVSSTTFTVGTDGMVNVSGSNYVAYLFAHDAGGFGDAGSDSIIKCGSCLGNATVDLGWEPQFLMIKASSTTGSWEIIDNMRGFTVAGSNDARLRPNLSDAEASSDVAAPTSTGFTLDFSGATTYIYIAIRRGPMKTPTSGTSVFAPSSAFEPSSTALFTGGSFPPDLVIHRPRVTQTWDHFVLDRLRGGTRNLSSASTSAEPFDSNLVWNFDSNTGAYIAGGGSAYLNNAGGTSISYSIKAFRRAPGFFDVVCYKGTGSAGATTNHNLGVSPELVITRVRDFTGEDWIVTYRDGSSFNAGYLNSTAAFDGVGVGTSTDLSSFTSTTYVRNTSNRRVNSSSYNYVAYLFASLSGVSKVGSYTGNGSSVTVTTNFQPRFILVKRTDSTGDWLVSDSARGLVAGNDPYLELNTTDAEVTNEDWVDISSTSFTVNQTTNNANVNTGTYIYLAIA